MDEALRARLAAARAGRNPYTDFRFASEYTDVPPTLGEDPAFEPSYPPYPYQRQAAHLIDNVYLREIPGSVPDMPIIDTWLGRSVSKVSTTCPRSGSAMV